MSAYISSDFSVRHKQESDDQLLSEARSGDQEAFAELYLRHRSVVMSKIYRIVRNREDAEDVLQVTFLKAYQHLHNFRGTCMFSTWLVRIGMNLSLMLLRKRKIRFEFVSDRVEDEGQSFEIADLSPNPEQAYLSHESSKRLRVALKKLPPKINSVIALYYGNEHGLKNAAKTLGITEAAAKSRVMRGRSLLRKLSKQVLTVARTRPVALPGDGRTSSTN